MHNEYKKYNIALMCEDKSDEDDLCQLSQTELPAFAKESYYVLGVNSHPHVTLAQFKTDKKTIFKIQEKLPFNTTGIKAYSTDFYNDSFSHKHSLYYHGVCVKKTHELQEIHLYIIENILKTHGIEPTSAYGDNYFPHFTLGLFRTKEEINKNRLNAFLKREINLRLAIGISEKYGRLGRLLTKT